MVDCTQHLENAYVDVGTTARLVVVWTLIHCSND